MGVFGVVLGRSLLSRGSFWLSFNVVGSLLGRLGGLLDHLGALVWPSWRPLGRLGAFLGAIQAVLDFRDAEKASMLKH